MGRLGSFAVVFALIVGGAGVGAEDQKGARASAKEANIKDAIEKAVEKGTFEKVGAEYKLAEKVAWRDTAGKMSNIDVQVGTYKDAPAYVVVQTNRKSAQEVANLLKGIEGGFSLRHSTDVMACVGEKVCVKMCLAENGERYCCKFRCASSLAPTLVPTPAPSATPTPKG